MPLRELIVQRLAREGIGGGDPERLLRMRADRVLGAWEYSTFLATFDETAMELNKGEK